MIPDILVKQTRQQLRVDVFQGLIVHYSALNEFLCAGHRNFADSGDLLGEKVLYVPLLSQQVVHALSSLLSHLGPEVFVLLLLIDEGLIEDLRLKQLTQLFLLDLRQLV